MRQTRGGPSDRPLPFLPLSAIMGRKLFTERGNPHETGHRNYLLKIPIFPYFFPYPHKTA